MNKINKYTKRSGRILGLNEDRGEAFWQYERGPRYGVARKARAKAKHQERRKERRKSNEQLRRMDDE